MPTATSSRCSLRSFADQLESHIRGLEALGKDSTSFGDLLVCLLVDKLAPDIRRNLTRHQGNSEWTLDELRAAIHREIDIMGDSCEILEDSESSISHSSVLKPQKQANVMFLGAASSNKESTKRNLFCPFCSGDHWPTDCDTAKTVEERYEIAKVKKLCYNCLRERHQADCPSKFRCRECNRAHHTSLHRA